MRLFIFILQLIVLVALAIWLSQEPGTAHLEWGDYSIDTSAAFLALAVIVVAYTLYLLFRLWHLLRHGPAIWRMRRQAKKQQEYHDCLLSGFSAIAGGDSDQAALMALKARKAGGATALTQFLQAQAAHLAGDHHAARDLFHALTQDDEGAILGYRGLITQARKAQNWQEMRRLMDKMSELGEQLPWLNHLRFELAARDRDWVTADKTLRLSVGCSGAPDRDKQNAAALLLAQAQDKNRMGQPDEALPLCEQAIKQTRSWLPAILMLAEQQLRGGHRRAARRTVERFWQDFAHPQLAAVYAATAENPLAAYRDLEKLVTEHDDQASKAQLLAEAAINAQLWGEARRILEEIISLGEATQSTYRLLATLERRDKADDRAALLWLSRSMEAQPDPHWSCDQCHGQHATWQANCLHCGSFNTLSWTARSTASPAKKGNTPHALGHWTEE